MSPSVMSTFTKGAHMIDSLNHLGVNYGILGNHEFDFGMETLQARLEGNADDHQARFDLALIANAKGDRQTAAGHLLEIMRRDRSFGEDAARLKLLEFFAAWGPTDPATKEARRRLSSLLFS